MQSLIDGLVAGSELLAERVRISKRPFPERPRDLFEALVPMGEGANLSSLARALDLAAATPRFAIAGLLGRWPTAAELLAIPEPYDARAHLAGIIAGTEFRGLLLQRFLTAYPDQRRLLFVRVPHCAGASFLDLAGTMHPIFPERLTDARVPRDYLAALGAFAARLAAARTIMVTRPRLAPFWHPSTPSAAAVEESSDLEPGPETLNWTMPDAPCRARDRLFTIVRDPGDIILGQVNRIAAALAGPAEADDPTIRRWRSRFEATLAACDPGDLRPLARRILAVLPGSDPLCHALGDGTCAGALEACARTDIEIADLTRLDDWFASTWDKKPPMRPSQEPPILRREDLARRDLERLDSLTVQDRPLYARIHAAGAGLELPCINGSRLGLPVAGTKLLAGPDERS